MWKPVSPITVVENVIHEALSFACILALVQQLCMLHRAMGKQSMFFMMGVYTLHHELGGGSIQKAHVQSLHNWKYIFLRTLYHGYSTHLVSYLDNNTHPITILHHCPHQKIAVPTINFQFLHGKVDFPRSGHIYWLLYHESIKESIIHIDVSAWAGLG